MRTFALRCMALAVLGAVAACSTVGPDYRIPEHAAVRLQAAQGPLAGLEAHAAQASPLPPRWWRLYDDPALDGLIAQAFAANTDLRVASANLQRAAAALDEADSARRPGASVSAAPAYGRASAAARGLPDAMPDTGSYDAGASVSYQVDLFGKIARAIEAANADAQAAQAAYDLARVTVAADTVRSYAQVCSAGRQLEVARASIALQEQFLALTRKRTDMGRGTSLDVSRAQGQLEQLRAALPPLEAQRATALYRLAVLTGQVPGSLPASLADCHTPLALHEPVPAGDGAALLRRRPDIRQAERALAAATARIGVATADLYPSITLGLSAGSTGALSRFGAANAFRWSLGPLISWSLPNTGLARSRIAQAEASGAAALARFDAAVLNALQETSSALAVYARDLDRSAALRAARDRNREAAEQARKLYSVGRTDFLTALDADRTLANAESALAAAQGQLASDQVALFLALGGGWE
ncbi:MAG: efflux transporter outer membrane subunit [Pigmentiphaga sp.]|uniref:efflux transporter outer membrane subunit n=1 Tax=Pigmentiphaga sp. TaxID=1977564 RepID=UPI0029B6EF18|nr:efflux transporter outer membrane subunit [Pigmentiphaga sp.]MDX3905496.1 efflux transporter outer membrane subunit [Pigmentiphaga sp.]